MSEAFRAGLSDEQDIHTREIEPIPGSMGFVFSGQGLSSRGALYEHATALSTINPSVVARNIGLMADASGLPLFKYIEDKDEYVLGGTHVVQAMIHGFHLAAIELLEPHLSALNHVRITAGHSAGEIAAMVAAEVISPEDSARVMAERGRLMHEASQKTETGLIIPLGFDVRKAEQVVDQTTEMLIYFQDKEMVEENRDLFQAVANSQHVSLDELLNILRNDHFINIALENEPNVNVLGGTKTALNFGREIALRSGARRVLDVDAEGAFHTEAMRPAAGEFGKFFRRITLHRPRFRVALNNGSLADMPYEMIHSHIGRMTRTSEWTKTMGRLNAIERVVKIGPGGQVPGVSEANGIPKDRQTTIVDFLTVS